ncbi:hypothetical protein DDF65_09430 [Caulobacter radicis]|uniref:Uncharacterized protein n=1 Tax=Caulobacter radicis TaxID=2172650 RepID=A0A2T9JI07_9CAUL|nr:hypothetical protein DDF65_09430 [Caulobacter radicis]
MNWTRRRGEVSLLPLREKVAAKSTDEGAHPRERRGSLSAFAAFCFSELPHPTCFAGPPSPTRGEGSIQTLLQF